MGDDVFGEDPTVSALQEVEEAVRPLDHHFDLSKLACLENTSHRGGGSIYPLKNIEEISRLARGQGLAVHLDGARLWNASVAAGIEPARYAQWADSVSVCLSKGLGAPVGSLLAAIQDYFLLHSALRRSTRRSFPLTVLGSAETNSIFLGYLYGAVTFFTCS